MIEHEKLKVICDEIGYKEFLEDGDDNGKFIFEAVDDKNGRHVSFDTNEDEYMEEGDIVFGGNVFLKKIYSSGEISIDFSDMDVREIIFTQEFMDKFVKYYDNKTLLGHKRIYETLGLGLFNSNLDNPVDYLYNLIF